MGAFRSTGAMLCWRRRRGCRHLPHTVCCCRRCPSSTRWMLARGGTPGIGCSSRATWGCTCVWQYSSTSCGAISEDEDEPGRIGVVMNMVVDTILRRHSVREGFSRAPIPIEVLEDIIRCGLAAPSSKNARPWRFHVVMDPLLCEELAGAVESAEGIDSY